MTPDAALLTSALAAGGTIHLDGRTYLVDSPLVATVPVDVVGQRGTRIEATVPMDTLLTIQAQCNMEKVALSGNSLSWGSTRYAKRVVACQLAAYSEWSRVAIGGGWLDGVYFAAGGNNDGLLASNCDFGGAGLTYGTACPPHVPTWMHNNQRPEYVVGGRLLLTPPPGVRPGCPVSINGQTYVVASVQTDGLSFFKPPPDGAASQWCLYVGAGWYEERSGDNNISTLTHCRFRGSAEAGACFNGLYGPVVVNAQVDYNGGFGFRVGLGSADPVLTSTFIKPYFESNGLGDFLLGGAQDIDIRNPVGGATVYVSAPTATTKADAAGKVGFTLRSPVIEGAASLAQRELNNTNWTLTGTNDTGAASLIIDPSGSDVVFNGTPAFNHPVGLLRVQCKMGQPKSVTLQGFLANYWSPTGIQLKAGGARVLTQGQSALFWSDGTHLWELA